MNKMAIAASVLATEAAFAQHSAAPYANAADLAHGGVYEQRERDWRNGAVVYQVLVDRYAPPPDLEAKRALYPPPKVLHPWSDIPHHGHYLEARKLGSHELDFWGGDLASLRGKLDYVQQLGADVLYLNPIHLAYTNHKYDALDYQQVSPEYGSRDDVKALAADLHQRGMRLVLDGVFNHMGRNSRFFQDAQANPQSPYRDWFVFGLRYAGGARAWALVQNLPELNLENPRVRDYLYRKPESVVRSYLRDGVDGWRLDVAFDIGFAFLDELTRAAHAEKPGSLVVGEIANYPKDWFPSVDGVLGFTLRHLIIDLVAGRIDVRGGARMIDRLIADAGIEPMLKSWIYLDNHDTARIATRLPQVAERQLAQVLQFTLPGSPNLYYGSELGMTGGEDPEMRAPMRWDWVREDNAALAWTKRLIALHRGARALRVGDYRPLVAQRLLAFERYTDRARDTVLVLANPAAQEVEDTVLVPDSKLMDNTRLIDLLGTVPNGLRLSAALLRVKMPPFSASVLTPDVAPPGGYTPYKRVQ